MAARAPSPKAHRNSSKSIGPILRDSSSEGIRVLRTFSVADILLYRDEGACLDVVVAAVCHEVLYELACLGEGLHLVEDDEGPALPELGAKLRRQVTEEAAHVRARIEERLPEVVGHLREVDQQVRLVLRLGELFDDRRLPNAARALDEERRRPLACRLPGEQLVVDLPLEHQSPLSAQKPMPPLYCLFSRYRF